MTPVVRRPDLAELVRDLCDGGEHHEPYNTLRGTTIVVQYHATDVRPLLTQLAAAVLPSMSVEAGAARPAQSRPAARIDAIDTLARIDQAATTWLHDLGSQDIGHNTIDAVRKLAALHPSQDRDTAHAIETDIRRWWTWARIITGWDTPPFAPNNTCPLCGQRGTLRIRFDHHIATCVADECRETWTPDTIGLLADHIRLENGEHPEHATEQAS